MPVDNTKIKVFDSDDDSLKILGELLSNDTSRKIIKALIEKEMYTNEIAVTLDIGVSLVIHHLNKMQEIGIVDINHKQIVKKGNEHRYFRVIPGLFVMPNESKEAIQEKGTLKKIFKEGIKFSSIFALGFIPIIIEFTSRVQSKNIDYDLNMVSSSSISFGLFIIILGLIIDRIVLLKK